MWGRSTTMKDFALFAPDQFKPSCTTREHA